MTAVNGGAILLEFHLGPPTVELPLTVLGHRVQHVGWHDRGAAAGWWREAWRPIVASSPLASVAYDWRRWPASTPPGRGPSRAGRSASWPMATANGSCFAFGCPAVRWSSEPDGSRFIS
jgi:hypothetical protein